jgi:hypothetical protein
VVAGARAALLVLVGCFLAGSTVSARATSVAGGGEFPGAVTASLHLRQQKEHVLALLVSMMSLARLGAATGTATGPQAYAPLPACHLKTDPLT